MVPRISRESYQDHFSTVDPQVNAEGIHIWPFDASFPVDICFLTAGRTPNVRINRHDYFEVLYLCSGEADLRVQDRLLPLAKGDLSIMGSTLYHRVEPRAGSKFALAGLFFLPEILRGDCPVEISTCLAPFLKQDAQFPHVVPSTSGVPREVFRLMQRIRADQRGTTQLARLTAKTHLKLALLMLAERYASYEGTVRTFERQQKAISRLQPVFNLIEKNFSEQIRVSHAARICGMSISHFINFFKNATGQSFVVYLNHYRIERAQQLIATTDRSLTDIGQDVGFCDQSYFGMVFRQLAGITPSVYREQVREDNSRAFAPVQRRKSSVQPPVPVVDRGARWSRPTSFA